MSENVRELEITRGKSGLMYVPECPEWDADDLDMQCLTCNYRREWDSGTTRVSGIRLPTMHTTHIGCAHPTFQAPPPPPPPKRTLREVCVLVKGRAAQLGHPDQDVCSCPVCVDSRLAAEAIAADDAKPKEREPAPSPIEARCARYRAVLEKLERDLGSIRRFEDVESDWNGVMERMAREALAGEDGG